MRFLYLTIIALCGCLLNSCTQDDIIPEFKGEDEVLFQTKIPVRGLIAADEIANSNTNLCLYGFHGNSYLGGGDLALNGKTLTYSLVDGANRWVVKIGDNPMKYFWQGTGDYKFFSWLTKDPNGTNCPFTPAYSEANKTLSIPAISVSATANQFDFLYSDIHERQLTTENMSEMKRYAVPMNMNHLFSAFAVGISNTTEDDITIKRVELRCLHDKGSAVIDFSGSISGANYGTTSISRTPSTATFLSYNNATGYVVPANNGVKYNIFNPNDENKEFLVVWPQAATVFPALDFDNEDEENAAPDTDFPLVVEYVADGTTFKKRLKIPQQAWEPGKKYYFEVQVADKLVELNTIVTPWDYTSASVDYKESTVAVKQGGRLDWDENTCRVDDDKKKVYVDMGKPVECTFTVDAPAGGQWRVSLEGDVNAFAIEDDTAPIDDGFGPIDGLLHRIKIVPQINNPDRDYSVRLKFVAITADSKTLPADEIIQDKDGNSSTSDIYTIVLESVL